MLKNLSKLECKVNDRNYQLLCDMDSPIHEVKEALFQFSNYIGKIEENVRAQQVAQEEVKPEEEKAE